MKLHELAHRIERRFSLNELHDLFFKLNIDYDDLPGATRKDKVRELVRFCERHGRLDELVSLCKTLRPKESWDLVLYRSSNGVKPPLNLFWTLGIAVVIFSIIGLLIFSLIPDEGNETVTAQVAANTSTATPARTSSPPTEPAALPSEVDIATDTSIAASIPPPVAPTPTNAPNPSQETNTPTPILPTQTQINTLTSTFTPTSTPCQLIFNDDFNEINSGWNLSQGTPTPSAGEAYSVHSDEVTVESGVLSMNFTFGGNHVQTLVVPGSNVVDFVLEFVARFVEITGNRPDQFALAVRITHLDDQPSDRKVLFLVFPPGGMHTIQPTGILTGINSEINFNEVTTVRIQAIDSSIQVFINGIEVTYTQNNYSASNSGLYNRTQTIGIGAYRQQTDNPSEWTTAIVEFDRVTLWASCTQQGHFLDLEFQH